VKKKEIRGESKSVRKKSLFPKDATHKRMKKSFDIVKGS